MKTKTFNSISKIAPLLMVLIIYSSGISLSQLEGQEFYTIPEDIKKKLYYLYHDLTNNLEQQTDLEDRNLEASPSDEEPRFEPEEWKDRYDEALDAVMAQDCYNPIIESIEMCFNIDDCKSNFIDAEIDYFNARNENICGEYPRKTWRDKRKVALQAMFKPIADCDNKAIEEIMSCFIFNQCKKNFSQIEIDDFYNNYYKKCSQTTNASVNITAEEVTTKTITGGTVNGPKTESPIYVPITGGQGGSRGEPTDNGHQVGGQGGGKPIVLLHTGGGGRGNGALGDSKGHGKPNEISPYIATNGNISVGQYSPETVTVTYWSFPSTDDNWIGLFAQGASNSSYLDYQYTGKKSNGSIKFKKLDLEPGAYEVRFFYDDSYNREGSVSFQIGNPPSSSKPVTVPNDNNNKKDNKKDNKGREEVHTGQGNISVTHFSMDSVTVAFQNFASTDDNWIGLFAQGASNSSYIDYQYTGKKSNGSIKFKKLDLEPGAYEVRFFYDDSYNREGSVSFQIRNSTAISGTKNNNFFVPPTTPTSPTPAVTIKKKGRHTVFGGR